jgi:hypothetical protein
MGCKGELGEMEETAEMALLGGMPKRVFCVFASVDRVVVVTVDLVGKQEMEEKGEMEVTEGASLSMRHRGCSARSPEASSSVQTVVQVVQEGYQAFRGKVERAESEEIIHATVRRVNHGLMGRQEHGGALAIREGQAVEEGGMTMPSSCR